MNKLPIVQKGVRICIICEGLEEYDYLSRLKDLEVWNPIYNVELECAYGNGNLPARYQDKFQNGSYDVALVFCDTDKKPSEQYIDIKKKIDKFHGIDNISKNIIIFGNPCTMQIMILHWKEVLLQHSSKKKNAKIIEQCTGITGYDAHSDQRQQMMQLITVENYKLMKMRVSKLSKNDAEMNSSNFDIFMDYLENEDTEWIDNTNNIIDSI